jgi:hypothetical protein
MSADDFKTIATEYADITKKITAMNKEVKTLKDQKDEIGVTILSFMQSNNIDECELPGGGKITRKVSKRTEGLKPELVLDELKTQLGDAAKAELCLQNINSKRTITEKEVISISLRGAQGA